MDNGIKIGTKMTRWCDKESLLSVGVPRLDTQNMFHLKETFLTVAIILYVTDAKKPNILTTKN